MARVGGETLGTVEGLATLNRMFPYPFEARPLASKAPVAVRSFSRGIVPGDYVVVPL